MIGSVSAVWENLHQEIIVVAVVFIAGMAWGALGMRLLGNTRRGWE